jgi:hypothetical protein
MKLLRNLFDFEREDSPGEVIFFKLFELFVVASAVVLAWEWGLYTLRLSGIVSPQGIARYMEIEFMFDSMFPVLTAALITACAGATYFRFNRYGHLAAFFLLHLQFAARHSLGKIPHGANMVGMTLLGLALAMIIFRDDRLRRRFTLGYTYFFVGLGYVLAGCSKLVGTGLDWVDGRHLWLWVYEKSVDNLAKLGTFELNPLQEIVLGSYATATLFLTIGLLTELCAVLVWWKRTRSAALLALIAMHAGIYFVMNIAFTLSVYQLLLLAFPWAVWLDALAKRFEWMGAVEQLSVRFA